ncbi:uncharacterized protein LOC114916478 [Cajanus cajan]|uniref:Uncharacterized protein n=1 Tax=Cajanus cajan TaxID=3821 RepID=A0A151SNY1_CAJCA|nr:uncharacterized protein LOC114916478 [Cajanus cajan]XP_029129034.1 uncharacterized protein LOC114916478 [Cajanus cajan]KYP56527.1 hypothetical protein KK1_002768 [Cajanus cajan]
MFLPSTLFIMILSLNVCTSRPLVAVEDESNTHFNISRKVSDNVKKQPLEFNGMKKTEGIKVESNIGAEGEESSKHMKKAHLESKEKQEILGFVPDKSVVLVSWHVPRSKQDQNPGFHSDYARPRTRPPSHN